MSLRLTTFSGLAVVAAGGGEPLGSAAQRRRPLAILAVLAASEGKGTGVTREQLCALFWPESDNDRARNALNQALFALRRELRHPDLLVGTTELRLNPAAITSDVGDFGAARATGDAARAAGLYTGLFLDGVYISGAPGFEGWAETERIRLAAAYADTLEVLATAAASRGDHAEAVARWRQRAGTDPLSGRVAAAYMGALAAAGDTAGALAHARVYSALIGAELGAAPDPLVTALSAALRSGTVPTVHPGAATPAPLGATPASTEPSAPSSARRVTSTTPLAVAESTPAGLTRAEPAVYRRVPPTRSPLLGLTPRRALALAACTVVAVALGLASRRSPPPSGRAVHVGRGQQPIMLVPFRTDGAEPPLRPLGDGLVDLLGAALTTPPAAAADSGAVLTWPIIRAASGKSDEAVLHAARAAGAGRVLGGALVGTARRLTIQATLTHVSSGRVRAVARVTGDADSVAVLAGQVASELLARDAGEPSERVAVIANAGLVAARAFLAGRAAFRGGQFSASQRGFAAALREEPSFTLAAVWLAAAANWTGDDAGARAAVARAWGERDALPPAERAYLVALAGPQHPAPSSARERFTAWQAATQLAPDRPDVWNEVGEAYFHGAEWLELPRARLNARRAFERALELDPAFQPARLHLVQLLVDAGDTVGARRQATRLSAADTAGESALFARWLVARGAGDDRSARGLTERLAALPGQGARWLVEAAVDDAIGLEDAERALVVRYRLAATNAERAEVLLARHALMLVRGRPAAAGAAVRDLESIEPGNALLSRYHIRAALYDGDGVDSTDHAASELSRVAARLEREAARLRGGALDTAVTAACVVGQWRLARGDTAAARWVGVQLGTYGPRAPHASPEARACRLLLEAETRGGAAERAARDTLDTLLRDGAPTGDVEPYLPLAVARVHWTAGDPLQALRAVRRRSYFGRWPYYLGAQLALDAQLSLAAADTVGAVCALRHRAALRSAPEPMLRADTEATHAHLARLTRLWATAGRRALLTAAPLRTSSCRTVLGST